VIERGSEPFQGHIEAVRQFHATLGKISLIRSKMAPRVNEVSAHSCARVPELPEIRPLAALTQGVQLLSKPRPEQTAEKLRPSLKSLAFLEKRK
jgi:hypothetical protein